MYNENTKHYVRDKNGELKEDLTTVINGHFIDTRQDKAGFLESNDENALTFYRCRLCHRVVSLFDLKEHHHCPYCHHATMSPTNLTFWEKLVQIVKHPKVWAWKNEKNRI